MHIFFSGIGGAGIGPLALIAHQAGYKVSGSDIKPSHYTEELEKLGIRINIGQTTEAIANEDKLYPIDWIVFSSAVLITNPENPELIYAQKNAIKISKRDECLNTIIKENKLQLIAVAGTHGKTSTTALIVWILNQLNIPLSYSVGAKIGASKTGDKEAMGHFDLKSKYFVYECDEFDRNFLSFKPYISIITNVDWDHHDIYPTIEDYNQAFGQFINQSNHTFILDRDAKYLNFKKNEAISVVDIMKSELGDIKLLGAHNRQNALLAIEALTDKFKIDRNLLIKLANNFPGSSRRFEQIAPNIYSDYAHTPEEISATMQMASEISKNIIVVYEPLTDRRQHYMKHLYRNVFINAKKIYWLPSYLAREDPSLPILAPDELISSLANPHIAEASTLDNKLKNKIAEHAREGDLVLCMAGGGSGGLDEWLRNNLVS